MSSICYYLLMLLRLWMQIKDIIYLKMLFYFCDICNFRLLFVVVVALTDSDKCYNPVLAINYTLSEKKVLSRTLKGSSAQRSAGTFKGSR